MKLQSLDILLVIDMCLFWEKELYKHHMSYEYTYDYMNLVI